MSETNMIGRLGNVLYWTGCVFAVLVPVFAFLAEGQDWEVLSLGGLIGLGVWLIGRALRYVLTGR